MNLFRITILGLIISVFSISCTSLGCTDETAENFDSKADEDNGECVYNEGCTDKLALNYDKDVVKDDGTCKFDTTGKAVFWTDGDFVGYNVVVNITKTLEGNSAVGGGSFKETVTIKKETTTAPECANSGESVLVAGAGEYNYTAYASSSYSGPSQKEKWEGTFTITVGECKKVLLEAFPKIKVSHRAIRQRGGTDDNTLKVVNKCSDTYKVNYSTTTGLTMTVRPNSTGSSTSNQPLWDGTWSVTITKESNDVGTGNCAGFYKTIEGINLSSGTDYEVVIGGN